MSRSWMLLVGAFAGCTPVGQAMVRSPETIPIEVAATRATPSAAARRMLVTPDEGCPAAEAKPCEILEIVDLHTHATSEEKGFDELRARAVAIGGDAIIGAEFEHGEKDEPSHLSGMIVRYSQPVPPYVEIGEVEVASDPNATDKGLSKLVARGRAIGGDRVVSITFEHGEDGNMGHLRGRAVRYVR